MTAPQDASVAVLVDCDNVPPDIVDHALLMGAQFGRVVLRRGYGNSGTLAHRWQDVLVRQAFTPCLQYQYASGKNTADIALALDALEALFDERVEVFCLVTSDSDFAYLCRKLRERGATVCIIGEPKTPDALRNACDQFFEWMPQVRAEEALYTAADAANTNASQPTPSLPLPKRRPRFVIEAVSLLADDASSGAVSLSALGTYLRRADPAFSPNAYGHSGLLNMIKTYDLLELRQEGQHWFVSPAAAQD
ncbi:NYN domain-containing protein [Luteimonas fraxinea]|nr:NYN domain-containing protein [Luteimonas fraxinea]UHH11958.1 NYN domain-containing protein [Luteimonas fraxinea]